MVTAISGGTSFQRYFHQVQLTWYFFSLKK